MSTVEAETDPLAGAGVASSLADFGESLGEQDAAGIAAAGTAAGLDSLGLLMDPLGTLAEMGVGWAIEHISFLREPLDALMGNPDQIEANAKAWQYLSQELQAQAAEFETTVTREVAGWEGDAADAYRSAAGRLRDGLVSTAIDTSGVAKTVLESGAMVGTVRSLVRDEIASWLADLIKWLIASVISAGLAFAAAVPSMVLEATTLALHAVDRIRKVVAELDEAAEALIGLVRNMGRTADDVFLIGSRAASSTAGGATADAAKNTISRAGASVPVTLPQGLVDRAKNARGALESSADANVSRSLRDAEPAGSSPSVGNDVREPGWRDPTPAMTRLDEQGGTVGVKAGVEASKELGEQRAQAGEWDEEAAEHR